jgi:hypothetical protein
MVTGDCTAMCLKIISNTLSGSFSDDNEFCFIVKNDRQLAPFRFSELAVAKDGDQERLCKNVFIIFPLLSIGFISMNTTKSL